MKKVSFFKNTFKLLKDTFTAFMEDKGLKLSASLAYYTFFHWRLYYF